MDKVAFYKILSSAVNNLFSKEKTIDKNLFFYKNTGGKSMRINKKGVTLIELIVVIVIIAIGAVLLVPNIGAFLPHYRLRSATRDMVSTMRVAQMKAVSNNMEYQVSISMPGGSYVLERHTGGLWISEGDTKTLPTGITISSNTFTNPANNALFRPNSSSNGGTLDLDNTKGNQRRITVLPSTGRITDVVVK